MGLLFVIKPDLMGLGPLELLLFVCFVLLFVGGVWKSLDVWAIKVLECAKKRLMGHSRGVWKTAMMRKP